MKRTRVEPGEAWAYAGTVLGAGVSIAANVAHEYVIQSDPPPLAIAFAVSWPVFLFVAIEILARARWPRRWYWVCLRFGGLVPVAGVAAVVSYGHLSGLLAHYGERGIPVMFGPAAVDGLMVMSTAALLAAGRIKRDTREQLAARELELATVAGAAAAGMIPAAVPDVTPPASVAPPAPAAPPVEPEPVVEPEAARRPAAPTSRRRPAKTSRRRPDGRGRTTPGNALRATARAHWDAEVAAGRTPSGADLARAAGFDASYGRRLAKQWRAELAPVRAVRDEVA